MAEKRKVQFDIDENRQFKSQFGKNHTLDSDEEESDDSERMHEDDIEGEEDGIARVDLEDDVKITPFNMKEELEEGHFDADGHYQFHKEADIKDNWLDNIDWVKVKKDANYKEKYNTADTILSSSDSEDEEEAKKTEKFDLIKSYREILKYMEAKESIKKTLQRLGKNKPKLTTAQRWKLKKQGITDDSADNITKLTELANDILTQTGNMDIYEETFEKIQSKIREFDDKQGASSSKSNPDALDIFSDDFEENKEDHTFKAPNPVDSKDNEEEEDNQVMWEYKMKQEDSEIIGPFTSQQMQNKVDNGDFKDSVFVRKVVKNRTGEEDAQFYTSSRIDFDLYI